MEMPAQGFHGGGPYPLGNRCRSDGFAGRRGRRGAGPRGAGTKSAGLLTQFEQFFTPDLARQLVAQPESLAGEDLEISTLFCDIQGFSRLSRDLGPAMTVRWVGDVLSTVSDCALNHQGVLIDYIGDALMAMWGAPQPQSDHPERARCAALEMLECLPALNGAVARRLASP